MRSVFRRDAQIVPTKIQFLRNISLSEVSGKKERRREGQIIDESSPHQIIRFYEYILSFVLKLDCVPN